MYNWEKIAIDFLNKSLKPVPSELNEIDWKEHLSDNTERLSQHLSAFANTAGGGFLVFGIDKDSNLKPISKEEAESIVSKLGNIARNSLIEPISLEHSIMEYENIPLLFVHVPESPEKPVHLRSGDMSNSYKRNAGQTVKITRTELRHLISTSIGISFETQTALSSISNDNILTLLDYDTYFILQQKRFPDAKYAILQTLASDNLIKKANSGWDILNLGAILFSRDINYFPNLRRKAVRVIVYKSTSKINALKEQIGARGYASGFEGLIGFIMSQLPSNEIIESALRKQVKVYPEVAIREFVANAIIHQDLTEAGTSVMVEIFSDRIEITNPGIPLVDTNRFIDTAPKSRNETMASLMRRLNICEERGSGIDRAIEAIESHQLPAPKFIKGEDYTRVIIYAPKPLSKMKIEDKIRACYQHTCLHYLSSQTVNNPSIRKRFNISERNKSLASKIISDTIDSGLIKASDPGNSSRKFASYIPFWA
jgi:ATP-dependent DNA helicase RecG